MRIESIRTLNGPNIYSYAPVLLMKLHLDELTDIESREIDGFNERLRQALPGLEQHRCSRGYPGGFVERLDEGTYFGHIIEHVAIELSQMAEIPVNFGKTRYAGEPGCYNVVVHFKAEEGMRHLLVTAVNLVDAIVKNETFEIAGEIEEAKRIAARTELGPSTSSIVEAARRRGIPCMRIGENSLVQLGYGKNRKLIQAALSEQTSAIAVDIAGDKELTKRILADAAIPVPRGEVARTEADAVAALERMGVPVVVKPLDGRQGMGVSLNLTTPEQVVDAFRIAREYSPDVLIEELIAGRNYRVLVVAGKMVAASERLPAHIVGDGSSTIAQLIEQANSDPRRGEGHEKPLTKIVADAIVLAHLEKCNRTLECVPPVGEVVPLREGINLSTGGTARDVTDDVHPSVRRICERSAQLIGLDICGVDLVLHDIEKPFTQGTGAVIELNAAPGLRMHYFPSTGSPRDVGGAIVDMLYPAGSSARIPIIAVTGTNGKTTVTRLVGHIMSEQGLTVGMTTTGGIYIGEECIMEGDTTGPQSARTILGDPTVDLAVLETARGGIVRRGLGYDWADVAIMTNIQADHFGQDGIEDLEDLLYIKSLVAERVRDGGTLILNADDTHLARLMENDRVSRVPKEAVYFSLYHNNPLIAEHLANGGAAYFLKDGWIIEARDGEELAIIEAGAIPFTIGGTAMYQIQNVMASIAAARAQGVPAEAAARALMSFRSKSHNPGRSNFYRIPASGAYVMIDYGHNPEAFRAVCSMAARWKGCRVTGVIGVPGDRDNQLITESGMIAAQGFHRIIIKEDKDLRGRQPGEIASLLCDAIHAEAPERECLTILDERDAVEYAIENLEQDDIAVVFYEKHSLILEVLEAHSAIPVESIEWPRVEEQAGVQEEMRTQEPRSRRRGQGANTAQRRGAIVNGNTNTLPWTSTPSWPSVGQSDWRSLFNH